MSKNGNQKGLKHQTIHCENCKDWLKLEYKPFDQIVEGIHITSHGMPILVCPTCKNEYQSDWTKFFIMWIVDESKKRGTTEFRGTKKKGDFRYDICPKLNFKYDSNDCNVIPGLQSDFAKEGFFTPVFFNQKVLHKYLSFDEYRVDIAGNTYGTIHFPDGNYLSYGINRNNKLFCWLGDIEEKVPENERLYLLSENIESDHDVASEFYAAQREAEFANYSNESKLLNERSTFDQLWNEKHSSKIFRYDKNIYDILEDLVRPVNWNKKGVIHVFNSLNKICIESLCRDSIIEVIKKENPTFDPKNIGALKLIEKLIAIRTSESEAREVMKSFFVLYDFRLVLDHDYTEIEERGKLDLCYERLETQKNYQSFEKLYDKLLEELTKSYSNISNSI